MLRETGFLHSTSCTIAYHGTEKHAPPPVSKVSHCCSDIPVLNWYMYRSIYLTIARFKSGSYGSDVQAWKESHALPLNLSAQYTSVCKDYG